LARGTGLVGRLARGGTASLAIQAANLGFSFALGLLLARTLGAEGYGVYAYAFTLVAVLSVPAKFGLPILIVREVARSRVERNWGALRGIVRWSNIVAGAFALVVGALAAAIALGFREDLAPAHLLTFFWALVLVPPMVLGELRGAALRGLGHVVQGQLPERVLRPAFTIVLCGFALVVLPAGGLRPDAAMSLHVLAALLAFGAGAWMYLRARPPEVANVRPVYKRRAWLSSAWPLALAASMQILNSHTDILMLGVFETADQVGIYRAASQCAGLVGLALLAINQVAAPQFAALYASGDLRRLERLAVGGSRLILAGAAPVAAILIIFGDGILSLLFGDEYASGRVPMTLLVLGQLSNAAFGSVGLLLNMSGHEGKTARAVVIAQAVNLTLNLILIPRYGSVGAAAASAVTITLWNAILSYEVRRNLGIRSAALGV
jgi:O-antigen/teichoic acid export membrane protein